MPDTKINFDFIEKVVQDYKNDDTICKIEMNFKSVGAKGDNYTSEVKRILLKYKVRKNEEEVNEELSLFLKQMHCNIEGERLKQSIQRAFCNEAKVMAGPLRRMKEILDSPLTPRLLYTRLEEPYLVIMEDLTPSGFAMANRLTGLDLPHSLLAIRGLARFHASSVAVCEKLPEYEIQFRRPVFTDPNDCSGQFMVYGLNSLASEIRKWEELGPRFAEKLIKLCEVVENRARDAFMHREGEFSVLNHGDLSQLNVLFTYDEQWKPMNVAFVDFQYSNYNSPGVDLQYFMSTSVTQDIYQHHKDRILKEYQSSLAETMAKLKCKTPTPSLESIKKMYDDRIFVSFIATCLIEPVIHAQPSDVVGIDVATSDAVLTDQRKYQGKNFKTMLTARLIEYDRLGLLNV